MDEKHNSLYPNPNDISEEQRHSALVAIGFSPATAPPPPYDIAINDSHHNDQHNLNSRQQQQQHNNVAIISNSNLTNRNIATQAFQQPITDQPRHVVNGLIKLGPDPCNVTCPSCGVAATTRMTFTPNTRTHLSALVLAVVGSCCCACTIPYCMNSCRTGNHYCGHCNAFLGVYNSKNHR